MEKQFVRKMIGVRVSPQENKLFEVMAQEQRVTVSEFLRTAGLTLAEMSVESREFLKSFGKDGRQTYQNIQTMLETLKETLANSIKGSDTHLSRKIDKIERLIGAFIYVYLFHTPEVKDTLKQQAKQSALARKQKVLTLAEDGEET